MRSLLLTCCALVLTASVAAGAVVQQVSMGSLGLHGQTTVYGGRIGEGMTGFVEKITIRDWGGVGGSDGAFSGFDLDFITFRTNANFYGPSTGTVRSATLTPGTVRNPLSTPFRTGPDEGPLFGMRSDGSVDHTTLNMQDAYFEVANGMVDIDASYGWISLGVGGSLEATIDFAWTDPATPLYLYVGDAGMNDEFIDAVVEVTFHEMEYIPEVLFYNLQPDQDLALNGIPGGILGQDAVRWTWDIDGTRSNPWLPANSDVIGQNELYPVLPTTGGITDPLAMQILVQTANGTVRSYNANVQIVPEPVSLVLLAGGALAVVRRRRRA